MGCHVSRPPSSSSLFRLPPPQSNSLNLIPRVLTSSEKKSVFIITTVFNPSEQETLYRSYHDFAARMEAANVQLITIECIFSSANQSFRVTDPSNKRHIQVIASDIIWIKENLINYAASRLPSRCKYIIWMDSDIEFLDPYWLNYTIQLLKDKKKPCKIVQLFEKCQILDSIDLNTSNFNSPNIKQEYYSFAYRLLNNNNNELNINLERDKCSTNAWGMKLDVFNEMGKLYERSIIDSSNQYLKCILANSFKTFFSLSISSSSSSSSSSYLFQSITNLIPLNMNMSYREDLEKWAAQLHDTIQGEIGYIPVTIRRYCPTESDKMYQNNFQNEGITILANLNFDPMIDLKKDSSSSSILKLNPQNNNWKELQQEIIKYWNKNILNNKNDNNDSVNNNNNNNNNNMCHSIAQNRKMSIECKNPLGSIINSVLVENSLERSEVSDKGNNTNNVLDNPFKQFSSSSQHSSWILSEDAPFLNIRSIKTESNIFAWGIFSKIYRGYLYQTNQSIQIAYKYSCDLNGKKKEQHKQTLYLDYDYDYHYDSTKEIDNIIGLIRDKTIRYEGRILQYLQSHDHIVKMYGIALKGNPYTPALITEYCNGGSLQSWLYEKKTIESVSTYYPNNKLTLLERIICVGHILNALQYINSKGIAHCDLKSSNILVHNYVDKKENEITDISKRNLIFKICDFNSAKLVQNVDNSFSSKSNNSIIFTLGNVRWTPPEKLIPKQEKQQETKSLDVDDDILGDIYSLGLLLGEIFALSPPFASIQTCEELCLIKSRDQQQEQKQNQNQIKQQNYFPFDMQA